MLEKQGGKEKSVALIKGIIVNTRLRRVCERSIQSRSNMSADNLNFKKLVTFSSYTFLLNDVVALVGGVQ